MRTTIAVAIVGVLAVGCGTIPDVGDPDRPVTGPPGVSQPSDDQPELVTPRPGMADVRPRPFEDVRVLGDGATLRVTYWSGVEPCYVLDHVEVEETDERVTVTLHEGHDPAQADTACIEIAVQKTVDVRLERPLGDREVVDGAGADP